MITVLIVEDDRPTGEELSEAFRQWGFDATHVLTVADFWPALEEVRPQVAVVDLALPDGSGADIIREIRAKSDIGIIVISGHSDEIERVACIEMGADDYLVKPCSPRELVARIRQLIYRTGGVRYGERFSQASIDTGRLSFADYVLDLSGMSLVDTEGREISLTTLEFAILRALVTQPRQVLSRDALLKSAHADGWQGSDRNVDNLVSRIRKKIVTKDGRSLVRTVRGAGYMFSAETTPV
jgi:two-component system OmpR family response regulator